MKKWPRGHGTITDGPTKEPTTPKTMNVNRGDVAVGEVVSGDVNPEV